MNILVLGASGMAGHVISLYFFEQGHQVTTLTRRRFNIGNNINIELNIESLKKLEMIVKENNFDAIINCIGILNESAESNKEKAVFLNSYLPHFLSNITKELKTKIIHMSTDCVFSGERGNYMENSLRDGLSFYDRSKALGELEDTKNITFRNSIIGPDINEDGIGLFNWFMKKNTGEVKGYSRAIWTGVTTLTLAKAMEKAIVNEVSGIYHLVNNEEISKYQLLKLINKYFKEEKIKIEFYENSPVNKSLMNNRDDFAFTVPSYEEMIEELKEWIFVHKGLYPHYFK